VSARKHPKTAYTPDLRRYEREAFAAVIDAYNQIKSTLGSEQAFDYSRMNNGAQAAQYCPEKKHAGFAFIDYVVDVENAIKYALSEVEAQLLLRDTVKYAEELNKTVARMEQEEKLGRVFTGRGLFPVRSYFIVVKK
jgi:hypothetical protein